MPGSLDPGRVKQEQSPGEDGKKTHVTVNLVSAEMASIQSNEAVKHFVYFYELSKKIKLIEIIFNNKTTVYIILDLRLFVCVLNLPYDPN